MRAKKILTALILSCFSSLSANTCETNSKSKFITDFPTNSSSSSIVGLQKDGSPILARFKKTSEEGLSVNSVTFERFLCNGKKDMDFGEAGALKTDLHLNTPKQMIQISNEGKILIAGSNGVRLRRYTENGQTDNSFGDSGLVEGAFTLKDDRDLKNETIAMRLHLNNKILVAGNAMRSLPPYNVLYFLARFNSDGTQDKSFGESGKIITGESEKESPELNVENMVTDKEGNIFLIGNGKNKEAKQSLVLHKFDSQGKKIKGPVAFSLPDEKSSNIQIKDVLIVQGSDLILYGENIDLTSNKASLILLKFSNDLEYEPGFHFEPTREIAGQSFTANAIGVLPGGYVLTSSSESTGVEATGAELPSKTQIIKLNSSGKEVIRLSENMSGTNANLPISLMEDLNGKFSLKGEDTDKFSRQGLEFILLKYTP